MQLKPRPNHRLYIQTLRRMSPAQRAEKLFELSEFTKQLFVDGLRNRHPELSAAQLRQMMIQRLTTCHNRNY